MQSTLRHCTQPCQQYCTQGKVTPHLTRFGWFSRVSKYTCLANAAWQKQGSRHRMQVTWLCSAALLKEFRCKLFETAAACSRQMPEFSGSPGSGMRVLPA